MFRAFLSHSSKQKNLVRKIATNLGKAQCVYDEYEFETGMPLLDEILYGLTSTELFVLFISNDSLNSDWVRKEINETKRNLDYGINKKIFPILIDSTINVVSDDRIPEWLKLFLLKPILDPFIITKKIKQKLRELSIESNPLFKEKEALFVGRNDMFDAFESSIYSLGNTQTNSIIVSGFEGIGRRTFLKMALRRNHKIKEYYDPIYLSLDTKDSIEDFILKLQDIEHENTTSFLQTLNDLSYEEKILKARLLINDIQESNEFIFIIDSGCIVQPTKKIANWYLEIIKDQKIKNIFTLNVIARFRPSNEFMRKNTNILHLNLSTLSDKDTEKLFVKYCLLLNLDLKTEDAKSIVSILNGIPSQTHYSVEYIQKYGIIDALKNLSELIDFGETQVYYLVDLVKSRGPKAYDLLVLIANFEFVSYELIFSIVGQTEEIDEILDEFFIIGIFDLVGANKEYIKVHFPIRDYLLRSKIKLNSTFNEKLKNNIKTFLSNLHEETNYSDISELLFSIKGAILEGHNLPRKYYVPSFVLKTIVDLYYKGNYVNVIKLIDKVMENSKNMDPSLNREFKYWLCLSLARKSDSRFEIEVESMDGTDYDYLYGFYNRFKKDFDAAYKYLKRAVDRYPNFQRGKRELVNVLLLKDDYSTALETAKDNYINQKLNAFHIQAFFVCIIRKPYISKEDKETIDELFKNIKRSYDFRAKEIANVMDGEYEFYINKNASLAIQKLRECIKNNGSEHYPIKALQDIYRSKGMDVAYHELKNKHKNVVNTYID